MEMTKTAKSALGLTIALIFILGLVLGYLIPRDIRVEVIEASGKYVTFHDEMKEYFFPFNQTDNVTMFMHGDMLNINHTVPNEFGIPFFELGFDNDGFVRYITQKRYL